MKYRINNYNEEYIMLKKCDITMEMARLQIIGETLNLPKDKIEIEKTLRNIWHKLSDFKTKSGLRANIEEIAIDKNSNLGTYVLNYYNEYETETITITINKIIHALLICIEDSKWEYYIPLSDIIMSCKKNNISTIDYNEFKKKYGQEITHFILTSSYRISNIDNHNNNKDIYLYDNDKITRTALPEKQKKSLIKQKQIN